MPEDGGPAGPAARLHVSAETRQTRHHLQTGKLDRRIAVSEGQARVSKGQAGINDGQVKVNCQQGTN